MSRKVRTVFRNAAIDLRKRSGQIIRSCVLKMMREADNGIAPVIPGNDYEAAIELLRIYMEVELRGVIKHYRNKKSSYEPLFSMPPARRPKVVKTGKPLTLVERRAASAKRKVREWQRKSKLASTKIKQYRKKVSYYTKKGVIQ